MDFLSLLLQLIVENDSQFVEIQSEAVIPEFSSASSNEVVVEYLVEPKDSSLQSNTSDNESLFISTDPRYENLLENTTLAQGKGVSSKYVLDKFVIESNRKDN